MAIYGWSWRCSFHFSSLLTIKISDCSNVYLNAFHVAHQRRTWFVPTTSRALFNSFRLSLFLSQRSAIFLVWFCTFFSTSNPINDHEASIWQLDVPRFEGVNDESMIDERTPDPAPKATTSESRLVSYDDLFICYVILEILTPRMRMEEKRKKETPPPPLSVTRVVPPREEIVFLTTCKSNLLFSLALKRSRSKEFPASS